VPDQLARRHRSTRSLNATAPSKPFQLYFVGQVVSASGTFLQQTVHSSPAFRGRIMALWVFVNMGTTPIGSILTGWIISAGGPMPPCGSASARA
jgi:hypothetical protein